MSAKNKCKGKKLSKSLRLYLGLVRFSGMLRKVGCLLFGDYGEFFTPVVWVVIFLGLFLSVIGVYTVVSVGSWGWLLVCLGLLFWVGFRIIYFVIVWCVRCEAELEQVGGVA